MWFGFHISYICTKPARETLMMTVVGVSCEQFSLKFTKKKLPFEVRFLDWLSFYPLNSFVCTFRTFHFPLYRFFKTYFNHMFSHDTLIKICMHFTLAYIMNVMTMMRYAMLYVHMYGVDLSCGHVNRNILKSIMTSMKQKTRGL